MVQVIGPGTRRPSVGERLSQGVGRGLEMGEQMMQSHQRQQAIKKLGLDPSILQLPEQGQAEYFKNAFAPEKQLTALQQSQKSLADERLKALQGQQDLFKRLGSQSQQSSEETQGQQGLSNAPEDILRQVAAFKGQPGEAGIIGNMADSEIQRRKHEKETSPEFKREQTLSQSQAQADLKYNTQLQEASKQHEMKKQTLNRLEQLNKKGVTGKAYEKGLEKFGLVALTSEGRREFAAGVKNLITDIRSILGSQFSQFEFQTILNAYPSADFSKEANNAILKNLKEFENIRDKEFEIADRIKKENKGKIPVDYQSQVNEKIQEYSNSRLPQIKENTRKIMNEEYGIPKGFSLMFDPEGEPLSVSENEIDRYLELGATLP